jgi:hypothetical protein
MVIVGFPRRDIFLTGPFYIEKEKKTNVVVDNLATGKALLANYSQAYCKALFLFYLHSVISESQMVL